MSEKDNGEHIASPQACHAAKVGRASQPLSFCVLPSWFSVRVVTLCVQHDRRRPCVGAAGGNDEVDES